MDLLKIRQLLIRYHLANKIISTNSNNNSYNKKLYKHQGKAQILSQEIKYNKLSLYKRVFNNTNNSKNQIQLLLHKFNNKLK